MTRPSRLSPQFSSVGAYVWKLAHERARTAFLLIGASSLWVLLVFLFVQRWGPVDEKVYMIPPLTVMVLFVMSLFAAARSLFWKEFASAHGLTYTDAKDISGEQALMFSQGTNRHASDCVAGQYENAPLQIFTYHFQIGTGKNAVHHYYTVFEFALLGSFPHLYLNKIDNKYNLRAGEDIPLPAEFEKRFTLSAPREYEIEALQIFTPDILARILENDVHYDVEIVDQEIIVFREKRIDNLRDLERELASALSLYNLLAPRLNSFQFTHIGDRTSYLRA